MILGAATGWSVLEQSIATIGAVLIAAVPLVMLIVRGNRRSAAQVAALQSRADETYAHINGIEESSDPGAGITLGQLVQQLDRRVEVGFRTQDAVLAEVLRQVKDQGAELKRHGTRLDEHAATLDAHRVALDAHSSALGVLTGRPLQPARPSAYTRREQK